MPNRNSLSFTIKPGTTDHHRGAHFIQGVLRFDASALILECRSLRHPADQADPVTYAVPLEEIVSVELVPRWLGCRLDLRANSLSTFEAIPGRRGDRLTLRIPRRLRRDATTFAAMLQEELADETLRSGRDESKP